MTFHYFEKGECGDAWKRCCEFAFFLFTKKTIYLNLNVNVITNNLAIFDYPELVA